MNAECEILQYYVTTRTRTLALMAGKEKLVVADEAGFVSRLSTTPEKPKGTFMPPVQTRGSPRLAAKRKRRTDYVAQNHLAYLPHARL